MADLLSDVDVEKVLEEARIGRIGCSLDGEAYVVPMTYAYEDGSIYCHSLDGKKNHMMRANPRVCFEVDRTHGLRHWESVIAHGTYEELSGADAERAMLALIARFQPTMPPVVAEPEHPKLVDSGIVFRIRLTEKTGRAEKP
jgi:nitroimidazol reductase NimA-like FMN-containing flavoprotein (pyridoxamine 5'-phosphate oxidase superfamily)